MRPTVPGLLLLLLGSAAGPPALAVPEANQPAPVIAVLPIRDNAGDTRAAFAVQQALHEGLRTRAELVDPGRARKLLRQLRLRGAGHAAPALLRRAGTELGAEWLVSATIHDAERGGAPGLTVSALALSASSGDLVWAGFEGGNGLDSRKALGLGTIRDLESLAPGVVGRLTEDLARVLDEAGGDQPNGPPRTAYADLGTLAIVPFDSITVENRTANAETVTEATRAALHRRGLPLVSPGCADEVLRRQQAGVWGGVTSVAADALRIDCGADSIITGSVETYAVDGSPMEPEPIVAIALRMVDPEEMNIQWADGLERGGWDREGLFRAGRMYSRGALTERLLDILTRRLVQQHSRQSNGREGEE